MSTVIDVRLFGPLELKSEHGCLIERQKKKSGLFLLLKYLLLEPQRKVNLEEVLRLGGTNHAADSSAARVQLFRLREMLKSLLPEDSQSLVTFQAGEYGLEASYMLRFDTDAFIALLKKIDTYSLNDPEGLKTCQQAIELYRGPLMEYTEDAAWLTGYRKYYQRAFVRLGRDMVDRMRTLNDTSLVKLLCARAVALAPEDELFQKELISFLIDNQMKDELAQHMQLLEHTGKAAWLKTMAETDQIKQYDDTTTITGGENVVFVRLFGDVELRNEHGHLIENRSRTPLLLLKYLLLKHPSPVTMDEILQLWPVGKAGVNPVSTVAVRLRRAREALRPLQLDKQKGLIHYWNQIFQLNPDYTLKRDVDEFERLVKKTTEYNLNDPEGLKLCVNALELFRGPLLEYTKSAPWLEVYRSQYQEEFCRLALDTLNRIRELKADEALPLLMQRSVIVAPDCRDLHGPIIQYLVEENYELALARHLAQLTRTGKATWMKDPSLTD